MEGHPSHTLAASEEVAPAEGRVALLSRGGALTCKMLAVLCAVVLLVGLAVAPSRSWGNLLLVAFGIIAMGLFGPVFVSLQYVSGAGWSISFRRVAEAMSGLILPGALLLIPVFAGAGWLYHWTHAEAVAEDAILQAKSGWLNIPFFLIRAVFYVVVWVGLAHLIVKTSREQDADRSAGLTVRNVRLGAIFLVLFGLTYSAASFDWVMSLEPHWFSTMFGVYTFSGMFMAGVAALVLVIRKLQKLGYLTESFTEDHLHDLGKLLFGFASFWAYIWFCQYMLIWYANIPEETTYFKPRMNGLWGTLMFVNVLLNWAIPFLLLMPRAAKRTWAPMIRVCWVVLIGRWLDLYLMILPATKDGSPIPGLLELAGMVGFVALFLLGVNRALGKANLVPVGDPFLQESLHHHV